jgi:catechol 2,3-dioxygenase-like lactoylglutathione lyase family enzyme
MGVTNFDHYTTRTLKFEESYNFYKNILGIPTEMNPSIPFRIAVVMLADNVHHHLMEMGPGIDAYVGEPVPYTEPGPMDETNIGTMSPCRTTNFDHLTFRGTNFDEVAARFKEAGYPYLDNPGFTGTGKPSPERARRWRVLQCMDPDGVKISINFEGE